ncbi:uncharacterized protein CTRU02_204665 [Colletotrichum truncatum]|uniref:Uncharacterized protein n=1 Tax=Colletotrichum truncatum TaxID=5467 RepID=A0ACC3ZDA1_COLTU
MPPESSIQYENPTMALMEGITGIGSLASVVVLNRFIDQAAGLWEQDSILGSTNWVPNSILGDDILSKSSAK